MASRIELEPRSPETSFLQSADVLVAVGTAYDNHLRAERNQPERIWLPQSVISFTVAETPLELDDATRSAMYINGLTEDNLPYYTETIFRMFGNDEALVAWAKRWTMEESRHGRLIERHQEHNSIFDISWMEAMRRAQLEGGEVPRPPNAVEGAVYVTIQEELTRVPHLRVASRLKKAGDANGSTAYALIAGDEAGHHRFYKAMAMAMRNIDPDYFIVSFYNQVRNFTMPGTGITDYDAHKELIAAAGIFDGNDLSAIVKKLVADFEIDTLTIRTDEAKRAREHIHSYLRAIDRLNRGHQQTREHYDAGVYSAPLTWEAGRPILLKRT